MNPVPVVVRTEIPGLPVRRGKVRDVYDLGDRLLLVATDRVSTYDVVHPTPIPGKGRILTALSLFWFEFLADLTPNHVLTADAADFPAELRAYADQLAGRSLLVRKAAVVPIECVVRGYLAGSGWKDYQAGGAVCGVALPPGLTQCAKLPEPVFTPATKAETGHDENISFAEAASRAGADVMAELRDRTLAVYRKAADYAAGRGILIADTKLEWGFADGRLILVDEVLTPDSSRFWPADRYAAGRDQESFDKQFVRNYAAGLGWNKQPPAPELPADIVERTRAKYVEAYERLTGRRWA
jgi:phosphoribosylaminoimidazole-succinocarboxamide synthase